MADWTSEDAGYKLSMNVLKALGGDTSASYENTEEVWGAINDIYDIDNTFNVVPIEETVTSNKTLEYNITDEIDGYGPVRISIDVKGDGKTVIPNGFRFTGGDLSLVEWDKYDWSMVYDTSDFFMGCQFSDPNWTEKFNRGFNGEIWSGYQMFKNCKSLSSLDLSGWDTSNVADMYAMFKDCNKLSSLDLSGWDTSKVTNMSYMFHLCSILTSLDVSHFNTSKVTNMGYMFSDCDKLSSLDLSGWDTSNVTNMNNMFSYCDKLSSLDVSHFNTSKVTDMAYMFSDCNKLSSLDLSGWDTSNVTNMNGMFRRSASLSSPIYLDVSSATSMSYIFQNCIHLTEIWLKGNPSKLSSVSSMFANISTTGTLYYDNRYDYSIIINVLPSSWTAIPYTVSGDNE